MSNEATVRAVLAMSDAVDAAVAAARKAWRAGFAAGWATPPAYVAAAGAGPGAELLRLEEARYGPLPAGWADPVVEEYPGLARRRARALAPRPGDFEGRARGRRAG